ncbi:hypothetical protein NA57DRAFT_56879 [Rhizodiscina lignyota]|uniref:Uncharacterized protein n=1 Tax=Rhizodiscina lignyota TaxID=1504668 RepID=A0A9P4M9D7_9PEZI|nr:hypothetical protein NA57DRAFT_56879 [Rhizodiscina lignyota]
MAFQFPSPLSLIFSSIGRLDRCLSAMNALRHEKALPIRQHDAETRYSIGDLPDEVLCHIAGYIDLSYECSDRRTHKPHHEDYGPFCQNAVLKVLRMRLVSPAFAKIGAEVVKRQLHKVYIHPSKMSLETFKDICSHRIFAPGITEIVVLSVKWMEAGLDETEMEAKFAEYLSKAVWTLPNLEKIQYQFTIDQPGFNIQKEWCCRSFYDKLAITDERFPSLCPLSRCATIRPEDLLIREMNQTCGNIFLGLCRVLDGDLLLKRRGKPLSLTIGTPRPSQYICKQLLQSATNARSLRSAIVRHGISTLSIALNNGIVTLVPVFDTIFDCSDDLKTVTHLELATSPYNNWEALSAWLESKSVRFPNLNTFKLITEQRISVAALRGFLLRHQETLRHLILLGFQDYHTDGTSLYRAGAIMRHIKNGLTLESADVRLAHRILFSCGMWDSDHSWVHCHDVAFTHEQLAKYLCRKPDWCDECEGPWLNHREEDWED